jgi:hypothetical protein
MYWIRTFLLAACFFPALLPPTAAQSPADEHSDAGLLQRVHELERRVAELERLLFGPSPAAPKPREAADRPAPGLPPSLAPGYRRPRPSGVPAPGRAATVFPRLPADFDVYAVGTYAGRAKLDVQLGKSGHEVRQVEVVVNQPERPVVLVLTAYDPVVWRVGRTPQTNVAAVLVSGYHTQALLGIERTIPFAISAYEDPGPFPYFFAHGAGAELLRMNEAVQTITGREIKRFVNQPGEDGVFHVGDPPRDPTRVIYSDDLALEGYLNPAQPLAGQKGLDQLVAAGKLRPATEDDIEAWVDKASEQYKRFSPTLRVEHRMLVGRTYVVLRKVRLPDGLFCAHSRSFIIPDGVPVPDGPKGHNTFYLMDGTATGPGGRAIGLY